MWKIWPSDINKQNCSHLVYIYLQAHVFTWFLCLNIYKRPWISFLYARVEGGKIKNKYNLGFFSDMFGSSVVQSRVHDPWAILENDHVPLALP